MVLLDVDFSDGDFLTTGVITSTSSMNGITTTINSNTLTKLKYVGSDAEGSISSSTAETTLATVLIPANTIETRIIVSSSIHCTTDGANNKGDFKLKIGPTGSEAQKQLVILRPLSGIQIGGMLLFEDDSQTWSADVTVLVTGTNEVNSAGNTSTCYQLIVTGY